MATLNRSYPEYVPEDNPEYAVPVQQGKVENLSVAITPDRQGILGWYDDDANQMLCAVVPVFENVFTDDVVPPGDVRVIFDGATEFRTVHSGLIWAWEGSLYAIISHYDFAFAVPPYDGKIEIFVADDIENPTSWSSYGMIRHFATTPAPALGNTVPMIGPIVVLDSGRWIQMGTTWTTFVFRIVDGIGLFTSDSHGVGTWDVKISWRGGAGIGGTAGPSSTTVGYEPSTGDLWWAAGTGSVSGWDPTVSTDDGTNWADAGAAGIPHETMPHYYIDNGTTLYAARKHDGYFWLYEVVDPANPSTWVDLNMRGLETASIDLAAGCQINPISWPTADVLLGVVFTARDRISKLHLCTPVHPDPLFIPYKDRLQHTTIDQFSIEESQERQFDNWKVFERWAYDFMVATDSTEECKIFVPWKQHSREEPEISAIQSFDNWKNVERWAYTITDGECGCNCVNATPPPDRCRLFIPWKDCLADVDPLDEAAWALAGEREFDNWKTLELWANRYARGECGCSVG